GQAGQDLAAGRVEAQLDRGGRVLALQVQQAGHDVVGQLGVDLAAEGDDAAAQELLDRVQRPVGPGGEGEADAVHGPTVRHGRGRPPLLHYAYGIVFPALLIGVAHWFTRSLEQPPYHVFFTGAAFFILGLTLRALMTGLGAP